MVRFLHTGDWQLGITRRFLDAQAQARYAGARLDVLRTIGRLAAERGAAFVVVAGDVFESNHLDREVLVQALGVLGEIGVDVHLLPGNHDPLDPASIYRSPRFRDHRPPNVHVLDSTAPITVADGVELVGAPWTSKRPLEDLVGAAVQGLEPDDRLVRIVVGHGQIDQEAPDPDDPALIALSPLEAAITDGRVQYAALGDRHSLTRVGTTGRAWYAGTPEPTDFDEADPGKVLVVDCDRDGCQVEEVAVGTWRFVQERAELDGAEDLDRLDAWLRELTAKERTIVRLPLSGSLSLREAARLDEILDQAAVAFASAERWDRAGEVQTVPDAVDLDELDLSGFARSAADELQGLARGTDAQAQAAHGALRLLYRLRQGADA